MLLAALLCVLCCCLRKGEVQIRPNRPAELQSGHDFSKCKSKMPHGHSCSACPDPRAVAAWVHLESGCWPHRLMPVERRPPVEILKYISCSGCLTSFLLCPLSSLAPHRQLAARVWSELQVWRSDSIISYLESRGASKTRSSSLRER